LKGAGKSNNAEEETEAIADRAEPSTSPLVEDDLFEKGRNEEEEQEEGMGISDMLVSQDDEGEEHYTNQWNVQVEADVEPEGLDGIGNSDMLVSHDEVEEEEDYVVEKNAQDEVETNPFEKEMPLVEAADATEETNGATVTRRWPQREKKDASQVLEDEAAAVPLQTQSDEKSQEKEVSDDWAHQRQESEKEQTLHAIEDKTAENFPLTQAEVSEEDTFHDALESQDQRILVKEYAPQSGAGESAGKAMQRQAEGAWQARENQNFETQERQQDRMVVTHQTDDRSDEDEYALETQRVDVFEPQEALPGRGHVPIQGTTDTKSVSRERLPQEENIVVPTVAREKTTVSTEEPKAKRHLGFTVVEARPLRKKKKRRRRRLAGDSLRELIG